MEIKNYSHKPKTRFIGQDLYYLGMELEVEAPDVEKQQTGLNVLKKPRHCCAKHDGSLSYYGWELVTQPIAKNLWITCADRLPVGTVLHKKYKGSSYKVKMSADGMTCSRQIDAATWESLGAFKTLTGIAKKITGYKNISGPNFFGLVKGPLQQTFRLVKELEKLGYNSHNGGRCGLHFHISRTAFNMGDPVAINMHLYWFCKLVNGDTFALLSQRDDFHYCARNRNVSPSCPYSYRDRYQAVNGTNSHTVEVRIFRGNLREDRIRKGAEACIAAVEFAQQLAETEGNPDRPDSISQVDLENRFLAFVRQNETTYPNLHAFLKEKMPINYTNASPDQSTQSLFPETTEV